MHVLWSAKVSVGVAVATCTFLGFFGTDPLELVCSLSTLSFCFWIQRGVLNVDTTTVDRQHPPPRARTFVHSFERREQLARNLSEGFRE